MRELRGAKTTVGSLSVCPEESGFGAAEASKSHRLQGQSTTGSIKKLCLLQGSITADSLLTWLRFVFTGFLPK